LWKANDFLPEVSSPVATSANVYVGTTYGVFVSINAKTGEVMKEHEFGGEFYSSPIIVDGKIYVFDTNGKVYIMRTNATADLITSFSTGEKTFSTPAFTDNIMVVRTEKSLYCVKSKP